MNWFKRAPKRYRLIAVLSCYLLGLAIGSFVSYGVGEYVLTVLFILVGFFLLLRSYMVGLVFLCVAGLLAGYGWAGWHLNVLTLKEPMAYSGNAQVLSVRFSQTPRQRVVLRLLEGQYKNAQVTAYVYDWGYKPGEVLRLESTITPSKYKSDLGRNGIGQTNELTVVSQLRPPPPLFVLREKLLHGVGSSLPEPQASLALGLLTGAGDEFDTTFKEDLQRTGTTHLVAVSGYNLTIVALLLRRWGQRRSRSLGFLLALASLLLYVVLAGATPSILRGATVAGFALLATTTGRQTHRVPLLLMSAAVLSLITPLGMMWSLSWQLSFLAFAGIVFVGPLLQPWWQKKLGGTLGSSVNETLSAQVLVLPLLLYQFGVISIVSPFVNVIVLSFTPLAMGVSLLQAVVSLLSLEGARLLAWASFPILSLVIKPIQWTSGVSFAAYNVPNFSFAYFLTAYVLLALIFGRLLLRKRNRDV